MGWLTEVLERLLTLDVFAWVELVGAVLVAALVVLMVAAVRRAALRARVRAEYGLEVPPSVRVTRRASDGDGTLVLGFPRWRYANRDGTADRRRSRNELVQVDSTLWLGPYGFVGPDPFTIYELANQARRAGHYVPWTREEERRGFSLQEHNRLVGERAELTAIYASFADAPTDFEEYCAELLRSMGYRVRVTPKGRDGGYDLELERGGFRYIAECKCYEPAASIGRPYLQKLEGANAVVRAEGKVFITTARYSRDAREYARQTNIELIDGPVLVDLARRLKGATPHSRIDGAPLSPTDLWRHYPPDARPRSA